MVKFDGLPDSRDSFAVDSADCPLEDWLVVSVAHGDELVDAFGAV